MHAGRSRRSGGWLGLPLHSRFLLLGGLQGQGRAPPTLVALGLGLGHPASEEPRLALGDLLDLLDDLMVYGKTCLGLEIEQLGLVA